MVLATDLSLSLPTKLAVGLELKDVLLNAGVSNAALKFTPLVVPPLSASGRDSADKNYLVVSDGLQSV